MSPLIYGPGPETAKPLVPWPDLSGLPVDDVGGRPTGEVFGLLSEANSGLIRYLDIAAGEPSRHVLVPIGHARIEEHADGSRVRLRAVTREDLATIPEYHTGEEPDIAYESEILAAYSRLFYGEHYYAHPAYDHRFLYVGEHPVESDGDGAPTLGLLSRLSGWRVASGEQDVRTWPVEGAGGREAGRVADLFVDTGARRVRYLVVERTGAGATLIPVGYAHLDRERQRVRLGGLYAADVQALPECDPAAGLDREDERRLLRAVEGRVGADRRFERPEFDGAGA